MTEIVRGAVETTPRGELEAAKALGLSPLQVTGLVLLPSALRRALPQFGNEVVFMLHGSVVASVITLQDILGAGRTLNAKFYLAYEGLLTAAALYMALTLVIVLGFRGLERRYLAHLRALSGVGGGAGRLDRALPGGLRGTQRRATHPVAAARGRSRGWATGSCSPTATRTPTAPMPMATLEDAGRWGPAERWPGVLAAELGAGWRVVEEGLPGRTTVYPDPIAGVHKNGLALLPAALESHRPIDLVVLMLGTNDLQAALRGAAGRDRRVGVGCCCT